MTTKDMKKRMNVWPLLALAAAGSVATADACTAVIVGKKASATGYVLVAHNEDNGGNVFVRHAFVPAREYRPGDVMAQEPECAKLPQGDRSYAYFWSEVKKRDGRPPAGDMMCNENGVLVFSNNGGWQKEWLGEKGTLPDEGAYSKLSEGGLGHNLRRAVVERARTAREGVDIATNLISRYGYSQASRIFTIADRDEAWVVEVIRGRRYVARRCPDDAVVVHPNCLSIREIRPDDIVSANIEPQRADFDFTKAYQGPRDWSSPYNRYRWKHLYDAVCGTDLPFSDYPFSVVPKRPVTAEMIKAGLRSHYEGTPDEVKNPHGGIPKDLPVPICRQSTLESFVCAFGATPAETVLSLATGRPCETPYVACRPFAGDLPGDCVCGDEAVERLNGHCRPLSAPFAVDAGDGVDLTLAKGATVAEKVWNFPVEKGTAVKFTVRVEYRAEDGRPPFNDLNVLASWVDARAGERHRQKIGEEWTDPSERDPGARWKYLQRDYVRHADAVSGDRVTRTFSDTINVPTNVVSVDVECFVKARPCEAKVLEVKAETVAALPKRVARIVLANPRRGGPSTIAARDKQVEKALDEVFAKVEKPDFVMACSEVFPESINKDPQEQSEPVPDGPTSRLLVRYAKEHGCYVAGGLCERDEDGVTYNAVVLFDRTGKLVGKYRKVHLTTGEFLGGKRAGDAFPVFETDFGKVGFCICWDNFFPETMRQLQLNGAELVVFPIAATGADRFEHVFRARCIDTGLPLAIQIRQGERPNRILGRDGATLAETFVENEPCWADIDLSARTRTWWLSVGAAYGDPYQLYNAERRPDVYQSSPTHADIGDVLRASVAAGDVAGVVSVVSAPDYSMRIDCAGYADVERKIPMRPDTVFALFSCSKSVCGTAVMILVGEGKLGLDDPVAKYIPEFAEVKVEEKGADGAVRHVPPKRPITVRDVMSHVSGSRFRPEIIRRDFPLIECARQMAKTPFKFQPGETFSYNNAGIDTGGAVVEVVSGLDYESFCQVRIFKPLGMKDTTFTPNADQIARLARCYNADGKPFADQAKAGAKYAGRPYAEQTLLPAPWKVHPAPSAGLYSTPLDFSRYSQMLAHHGEWQGVRLIPEKLFRETYVVKQTADKIESPYTIGNWIRGEWFGHSGAMKSDQRVNVRTGHSRCYFAQIMPPGGDGFERSKDAWNLAVDAIQCAEGATPCLDHSTKRTSGGKVKTGR